MSIRNTLPSTNIAPGEYLEDQFPFVGSPCQVPCSWQRGKTSASNKTGEQILPTNLGQSAAERNNGFNMVGPCSLDSEPTVPMFPKANLNSVKHWPYELFNFKVSPKR